MIPLFDVIRSHWQNVCCKKNHASDEKRIQAAYRSILGRSATSNEIERVKKYLAEYESGANLDCEVVCSKKPNDLALAKRRKGESANEIESENSSGPTDASEEQTKEDDNEEIEGTCETC